MTKKKPNYQFLRRLLDFYTYLGVTLLIVAIVLITIPLLPYFYYVINAQATSDELGSLEESVATVTPLPSNVPTPTPALGIPSKDTSLPKENWLKIDKIGVDTEIIEDTNAKRALYKGVWRDPQFPNPTKGKPMILAAHRYGYLEWSSSFRRKSSFRNLPQLTKGDKIVIYWDQRPFEYEIYSKKSEKVVSDYNADLILYTCQYLKSDKRIFIYARRVK